MQPYIRDVIVDALIRNPRESWRELEVDVNFWCSYSAIRRWLMSREGFRYYTERIIPLLSPQQMQKHLYFAKRFRNNWGLGGGKFLLIMFDEKWFWGMVLRSYAKAIGELGIDPKSFSAYRLRRLSPGESWRRRSTFGVPTRPSVGGLCRGRGSDTTPSALFRC